MMLKGKIIRLVNMTVVITLFLSTLNVSSINIPLSFSETQGPQVYQESAETQPVFEKREPLSEPGFNQGLMENLSLHEFCPSSWAPKSMYARSNR